MRTLISSILLASIAMHAHASENNATYPNKPIRIVVGFTAGGPTDVIGRAFAHFVGTHTGKDMIVDNKPGANSTIATRHVSQAKPDGYTLLGAATNHTMIPALYGDKVNFDVEKSFTPICSFAKSPTVLVVSAGLNVKNFAQLLDRMKKEPGKFLAASAGVGSSGHFATALFEKIAQVRLNHVPYNGAAPAITAVMGGQVDMSFATLASVLPQATSVKLKILAVASEDRLPSLPDVPTFSEAGIKGYSADAWYGFLAPVGTPADAIATLEEYVKAYRVDKTAQKNLKALGLEPDARCGAEFAAKIKNDVHTYTELSKNIGIKQ